MEIYDSRLTGQEIYDSRHTGQEVDDAVDAVQTTIPSQLTQIGLNLDDLESSTVWNKAQTLSSSQKATARANIGAVSNEEVAQQISVVNSKIDDIKPINLTNNGTITNLADEEDITSEDNLLKLKDRYNYVILRSNKTFASQVTKTDTIYEIRYDFDLDEESVTIPSGCVLKFNGGSVSNGTLNGMGTAIESALVKVFDNITLSGTFIDGYMNAAFFGAEPTVDLESPIDISSVIQGMIDGGITKILIPAGIYYIGNTIEIDSKSINFRLGGVNDKAIYDNSFENAASDTTILYTNLDIPIIHGYGRFSLNIEGGIFDVSKCDSYSSAVIDLHGESIFALKQANLSTTIIGKPIREGWHGTGTGLKIQTIEGVSSSATFVNLNVQVSFFEYGVYLKSYDNATSWANNIRIKESSYITHCKTGVWLDGPYRSIVEGIVQCGYVGTAEHNLKIPAVYINGDNITIDCYIWDVYGRLGMNDVGLELGSDTKNAKFGNSFFANDCPNVNMVGAGYGAVREQYPIYLNETYKRGYREILNWFIDSNEFSYTVQMGSALSNYDSSRFVNLFNPTEGNSAILTSVSDDCWVEVTITLATPRALAMMGTLMTIGAGAFTNVYVKYNYSDSTYSEGSNTINPEPTGAKQGYVFFNIQPSDKKISSIVIKYSNPIRSGYVTINSIFGILAEKSMSYLHKGGGKLLGGAIERVDGKYLFPQKNDSFDDSIAGWSVGAMNFVSNGYMVNANGTKKYITLSSDSPLTATRGTTSQRPAVSTPGFIYFDESLHRSFMWEREGYVDHEGYLDYRIFTDGVYQLQSATVGSTVDTPSVVAHNPFKHISIPVLAGDFVYLELDMFTNATSGEFLYLLLDSANVVQAVSYTGNPGCNMIIKVENDGTLYINAHTQLHSFSAVRVKRGRGSLRKGYGDTAYRPTLAPPTNRYPGSTVIAPSEDCGFEYFDVTLGKTVWWNGTNWVEADGEVAGIKRSGTSAERPTPTNVGFMYFDTTLGKMIVWNGTAWVNMDGSALS